MINHFFETLMMWHTDNGVFYLSGRDAACCIAGICIGIIFAYLIQYAKYLESEWKKERKKVKWRKEYRRGKNENRR